MIKRICIFLNGKQESSSFKFKIENTIFKPLYSNVNSSKNTDIYLADGGLNYFLKMKPRHDNLFWIGDADSIHKKSKNYIEKNLTSPQITLLNTNKDFSDFAFILDLILKNYEKNSLFIEIYGGLGKRRGHEISNIKEIEYFLEQHKKKSCVYFHGGLVFTSLPIKIYNSACPFFSIFAINKNVEIDGAQYSGNILLQRPSHGLSNKMIKKVLNLTPINGVIQICFED